MQIERDTKGKKKPEEIETTNISNITFKCVRQRNKTACQGIYRKVSSLSDSADIKRPFLDT